MRRIAVHQKLTPYRDSIGLVHLSTYVIAAAFTVPTLVRPGHHVTPTSQPHHRGLILVVKRITAHLHLSIGVVRHRQLSVGKTHRLDLRKRVYSLVPVRCLQVRYLLYANIIILHLVIGHRTRIHRHIVVSSSIDLVVPGSTADLVIPCAAVKHVVPGSTINVVRPAAS